MARLNKIVQVVPAIKMIEGQADRPKNYDDDTAGGGVDDDGGGDDGVT